MPTLIGDPKREKIGTPDNSKENTVAIYGVKTGIYFWNVHNSFDIQ